MEEKHIGISEKLQEVQANIEDIEKLIEVLKR